MTSRSTSKHIRRAAFALCALAAQAALAVPTLSVAVAPNPAVPGSTVAVEVRIADVADLYAYQFSLAFNPAVLQASAVTEASFLTSGGGTTFFDGGAINNSAGTISFTFDSLIGPVAGVSGSGALVRIGFGVAAPGTSTLAFSDVLFIDSNLNDITVQVANGSVQAVPEPSTLAMLGVGLLAVAGGAWRRRAVATPGSGR